MTGGSSARRLPAARTTRAVALRLRAATESRASSSSGNFNEMVFMGILPFCHIDNTTPRNLQRSPGRRAAVGVVSAGLWLGRLRQS